MICRNNQPPSRRFFRVGGYIIVAEPVLRFFAAKVVKIQLADIIVLDKSEQAIEILSPVVVGINGDFIAVINAAGEFVVIRKIIGKCRGRRADVPDQNSGDGDSIEPLNSQHQQDKNKGIRRQKMPHADIEIAFYRESPVNNNENNKRQNDEILTDSPKTNQGD